MATLHIRTITEFENFRDNIMVGALNKHLSMNVKNPNVKNELASALLGYPEYHKLKHTLTSEPQWWQKVIQQRFIPPMDWMALYGPTGEEAATHIYIDEPSSFHVEYMANMDRLQNGDEITFDWYPHDHGKNGEGELNPCFSFAFGEFLGGDLDLWFSIGMATYGCSTEETILGYLSEGVVIVNDKEIPVDKGATLEQRILKAISTLPGNHPLYVLLNDTRKAEAQKMLSEVARVSNLLHRAS